MCYSDHEYVFIIFNPACVLPTLDLNCYTHLKVVTSN